MKAAFYEGKKTIRVRDVTRKPPGPNEVQIEIAYCGICGTDLHIFLGHMDKRVSIPQVLGHEMSGIISEVGENVKGWKKGDRVVVRPLNPCGKCFACQSGYAHICYNLKFIGIDSPGAFQEFWNVPADTLHKLPDFLSLERSALIEPLSVACHDVRVGEVKKNDYVVVIGGGPIGILIALVAQLEGARVLLSEINSFRKDFASNLGIKTVNPKEVNLTDLVFDQTDGVGADIVFEVSGSVAGASMVTELTRVRGRIVVVGIFNEIPKVDLFQFFWRELELKGARLYNPEDFEKAIQLASSGQLPIDQLISEKYPLSQIQSAFEKIESRSEIMKVLIDIKGG